MSVNFQLRQKGKSRQGTGKAKETIQKPNTQKQYENDVNTQKQYENDVNTQKQNENYVNTEKQNWNDVRAQKQNEIDYITLKQNETLAESVSYINLAQQTNKNEEQQFEINEFQPQEEIPQIKTFLLRNYINQDSQIYQLPSDSEHLSIHPLEELKQQYQSTIDKLIEERDQLKQTVNDISESRLYTTWDIQFQQANSTLAEYKEKLEITYEVNSMIKREMQHLRQELAKKQTTKTGCSGNHFNFERTIQESNDKIEELQELLQLRDEELQSSYQDLETASDHQSNLSLALQKIEQQNNQKDELKSLLKETQTTLHDMIIENQTLRQWESTESNLIRVQFRKVMKIASSKMKGKNKLLDVQDGGPLLTRGDFIKMLNDLESLLNEPKR